MQLSGRRILVTGASSGIGRETAILLSQLGAEVTLSGRDENRLAQTAARLFGTGHRIKSFDLSRLDEIPQWMKGIAEDGQRFSGLVHCAGIHSALPLQMMRAAVIEEMMRVNVGTAALLARGFRQKECRSAVGCSLVFLASVAGLVGESALSAYSASKAAVIGLVRALAIECAREQIRVNAVAPGFVRTEMAEKLEQQLTAAQFAAIAAKHPLGIGSPRDVANAVAFLLADTGCWITGTTMVVDGGYTAH